jgi:hypothetical protein
MTQMKQYYVTITIYAHESERLLEFLADLSPVQVDIADGGEAPEPPPLGFPVTIDSSVPRPGKNVRKLFEVIDTEKDPA